MQYNPENIYYENGISSVPYTMNIQRQMYFNRAYGYTPNEQPMYFNTDYGYTPYEQPMYFNTAYGYTPNKQSMYFNTAHGYTPNEQSIPNPPVEQFQRELPSNQEIVQAPRSIQSNTENIHDYLVWSIINICFGGLFLGIIAVLLSSTTKERKKERNIESAKRWSRATLGFNIFIDLVFIAILIAIIVYFATGHKTTLIY